MLIIPDIDGKALSVDSLVEILRPDPRHSLPGQLHKQVIGQRRRVVDVMWARKPYVQIFGLKGLFWIRSDYVRLVTYAGLRGLHQRYRWEAQLASASTEVFVNG